MEKIIVTRHKSVERYLKEKEIVPGYTPCYPYISKNFAKGKHIYGIVPMEIAEACEKFTEVKITLPRGKKAESITLDELESCVKSVRTYIITENKEERII